MYFAAPQTDMAVYGNASVITGNAVLQGPLQRPLASLIRPIPALFHRYIELICQKAG